MWQAIVDKVANVFAKSDAYIDQNQNSFKKHQRDLEANKMNLPNAQSWCEALSLIDIDAIVKADLTECFENGENVSVEAKEAFRNLN